mmetsp:Transcript_126794/g.364690  ORF Transcript_126794/g.364690 Transcript_126794/m.364690 type:complete len:361 (-) Transcript_126794:53-1135(-)
MQQAAIRLPVGALLPLRRSGRLLLDGSWRRGVLDGKRRSRCSQCGCRRVRSAALHERRRVATRGESHAQCRVDRLPRARCHDPVRLRLDFGVGEIQLEAILGAAHLHRCGRIASLDLLQERRGVLALRQVHDEVEHGQIILLDRHLSVVLGLDPLVGHALVVEGTLDRPVLLVLLRDAVVVLGDELLGLRCLRAQPRQVRGHLGITHAIHVLEGLAVDDDVVELGEGVLDHLVEDLAGLREGILAEGRRLLPNLQQRRHILRQFPVQAALRVLDRHPVVHVLQRLAQADLGRDDLLHELGRRGLCVLQQAGIGRGQHRLLARKRTAKARAGGLADHGHADDHAEHLHCMRSIPNTVAIRG